ncbi:MAG: hypothetical protein JNL18_25010 [Planctomycetaceae bacterium]|nr:hypothetical protein [Planctomycetaceae bacterium]
MTDILEWICKAARVSLAWFLLGGCNEAPRPVRLPTFPVTGTLYVNGEPAVGAMVKFHDPSRSGRTAAASVKDDGSFAASFYGVEDGVPAGEYRLLILWMAPPPGGGLPVDRLNGRFADPARPVRTVKIVQGETHLGPIDLTLPDSGNK